MHISPHGPVDPFCARRRCRQWHAHLVRIGDAIRPLGRQVHLQVGSLPARERSGHVLAHLLELALGARVVDEVHDAQQDVELPQPGLVAHVLPLRHEHPRADQRAIHEAVEGRVGAADLVRPSQPRRSGSHHELHFLLGHCGLFLHRMCERAQAEAKVKLVIERLARQAALAHPLEFGLRLHRREGSREHDCMRVCMYDCTKRICNV